MQPWKMLHTKAARTLNFSDTRESLFTIQLIKGKLRLQNIIKYTPSSFY